MPVNWRAVFGRILFDGSVHHGTAVRAALPWPEVHPWTIHVEAAHIVEWVRGHQAVVVGPGVAAEFAAALEALPWAAMSLDKAAMSGVLTRDDAPELAAQVHRARLGRHPYVYVMYDPDASGLIAPLADVLTDLDLLYWLAPGYRYFCGASIDLTPSFDDLAEYEADYGTVWLRS